MPKTPYQATFSPCHCYRYEWFHRWAEGAYVMFIGLNPSTANQTQTDPTVRRCIDYAKQWGYGALCMTNLFAWRATDPAAMKRQANPIGVKNDATLQRLAAGAGLVVAAWGTHGSHLNRGAAVRAMLPNLHALKQNQDGTPAHPLYLNKNLKPFPDADRQPAAVGEIRKKPQRLYLDVIPRLTAEDVGGFSEEAMRKRGVALAGTLDEAGRFCLFRQGQSSKLAAHLKNAQQVVGYNCLNFDYELIRGETRFVDPPTVDLMAILTEAAGHRISFQKAVQRLLGHQTVPCGGEIQTTVLAGDWESAASALESKLRLMARLHSHLEEHGVPKLKR